MSIVTRMTCVVLVTSACWVGGVSAHADPATTTPTTAPTTPVTPTTAAAPPTSDTPPSVTGSVTTPAPSSADVPSTPPVTTSAVPSATPSTDPSSTPAPAPSTDQSATPTPSATVAPGPVGDSTLMLAAVGSGDKSDVRSATLSCQSQEDSTHPKTQDACSELAAVGGDFDKLTGDPAAKCDQGDNKITLLAVGTWEGKDVLYQHEFPNWCSMENAAKFVYKF